MKKGMSGTMGDTLITVIAIFLAATLMFVFPLMAVSERSDDIAQLNVQTLTTQFVDNIRSTGKITDENYDNFAAKLATTGNTYDITFEVKVQDVNPKKAGGAVSSTKIGENLYYSEYTSQVLDKLNSGGQYLLKEGDIVSVNVKNTNKTISELLRGFFYSMSGNDTYQVAASHAGIVMTTGK